MSKQNSPQRDLLSLNPPTLNLGGFVLRKIAKSFYPFAKIRKNSSCVVKLFFLTFVRIQTKHEK